MLAGGEIACRAPHTCPRMLLLHIAWCVTLLGGALTQCCEKTERFLWVRQECFSLAGA